MTETPDEETKRQYLDNAINAANALRLELGRKVPGPLTVAPDVALLGGVVSVHMAHTQAEHLTHIVHEYNPPGIAEIVLPMKWGENFKFEGGNYIDDGKIVHHVPECKWGTVIDGKDLFSAIAECRIHAMECVKFRSGTDE